MLDLAHYQIVVQAKLDATTAASTLDDLVTLSITVSKIRDAIAVSDVQAAATAGVTSISGAATAALGQISTAKASATDAIGTARGGALTDIEAARVKAIQDVQAAGGGNSSAANISYAPAGSLTATNVQAALGQLDTLKLAKASNLSDIADAKAARANLGLEKFTARGDAAYTILAADRTVALTAALTAPRTFTLPAANTLNPGATLRIMDQAGGISAASTLTIQAAGTDKLNGAAAAIFAAPYTDFLLTTDGVSAWTYDVQGLARGGTGATTAAGARANLGLGSVATLTAGAAAGNVPVLDGTGKLLASLLPALAISDVFTVASQAAMLALTAERGDVAIRTDTGTAYILATDDPTTLANWKALPLPAGVVMQVAGLSGPSITASQLKTALGLVLADITDASANGRSLLAMTYAQMATALGVPSVTKATAALIRAGADDAAFITAKALADAGVPVQVPYTATVTLDLTAGTDFEIDPLTGNLTLANPAVIPPRWSGTILLPQDATGGRTISYGSAFKIAGGTPTASTAANAVDMLACRANRAGTLIRASFLKGFA